MTAMWFYLDGEQHRGPVTIEELVGVLLADPDPRNARVWREGLSDWQAAGSVPEISDKLPPSEPSIQRSNDANRPVPFAEAEAIAQLYRRLVLLVGLQILLSLFQLPGKISPPLGSGTLALAVSFALIGLLVAIVVTAYKLTRHLGESLPILWAIAMFIPCLNLIGLLVISSKAQAWCRRYGIKVGFFGPTKASIEELRRGGITSDFE